MVHDSRPLANDLSATFISLALCSFVVARINFILYCSCRRLANGANEADESHNWVVRQTTTCV